MTQSTSRLGRLLLSGAVAAVTMLSSSYLAVAEEDSWPSLRQSAFGDRAIAEDGMVILDAPQSAEDAAIVPLTVRVPPSVSQRLKSLTLFIDKNRFFFRFNVDNNYRLTEFEIQIILSVDADN